MIQRIVVNNFKSLKHLDYRCAGLNLLMGLNGSGKSSLIQSLLFLRKCASMQRYESQKIDLKNDLFDIGTAQDLFYAYNQEDATVGCCFEKSDTECSGSICLRRGDGTLRFVTVDPDFFDGLRGSVLSRIRYISTNRLQAEIESFERGREYGVNDFGSHGENVLSYLVRQFYGGDHELNQIIWCDGCESAELQDQIEAWLQEISPGVAFKYDVEEYARDSLVKIRVSHDNVNTNAPWFRPQNVGYGISYAFYVVALLLTARAGEIVIVEDPEAHLHPRGQSAIGRLLAKVAATGVQVFVETHSDHIVNGVRIAVRKGCLDSIKANIAFFHRDVYEKNERTDGGPFEYYSSVENISIDRNGSLSDYPEGFMDGWDNQLMELVR